MLLSQRSMIVLIVGIAACLAAVGELAAQPKTPVPDAEAQQTAKKAAGELFAERFKQAKTTAEKTALATDMMGAASKVQAGSADQYVLLKIARDVAAGTGDAATALQAAERLLEQFDEPAAELIGDTLLTAAREATISAQHKAVAEAALNFAGKLTDADQYETALRLCEAAGSSAQKAKLYPLAKKLTAQIEDIKRQQRLSEDCRKALSVLDAKPTDPEANLAAGRHLCFVKGDWKRGVPMLALGSDAPRKGAAIKDLRGANSADEQAAIGDAWWDLAEARQGDERDALRLRAGFWYRQAEPKLAGGLIGLKVKQRLGELATAGLSSRLDEMAEATNAAPSRTANRGLGMLVETSPAPASDAPVFRFQTFAWKDGDQPARMIPVKNGFCFLSMVSGNLMGRGEAVEVTAGAAGWWYLNGKSQQVFSAQAIAAESDSVKLSPARVVPWKQGSPAIRLIHAREGFCCLSAISGGLRGAGEAVHVAVEQDGWWYLSGKAAVPLQAMAAVVPWPPRQERPEVTSYTWRRGDAPVKMIHKSEGFCLLTGIGGGFHGGGEQVEIALGVDDFWYLRGKSQQSGTFGEAIAVRFADKPR